MKRYPFGMPAWAYWVLVVLAASIIGSIPVVGTVLFLAAVGVALWWFFAKVTPERDRKYADYAPAPVVGSERLTFDRLEVVGESHYMVGISRAVGVAGRELDAVLAWEPRNPHSRSGDSVRVDLVVGAERLTCGYLPSGISGQVLPLVRSAADRGLAPMIEATVFGGTASKPNYGVLLGTGPRSGASSRRGVRFE